MNLSLVRFVCRILVVCMIGLPWRASAGMIGTDQAVNATRTQAERTALVSFVSRAEVTRELQALGLSTNAAQERVAALTDDDIARLSGQIENLPAGAHSVEILVLIAIAMFIWWSFATTSR